MSTFKVISQEEYEEYLIHHVTPDGIVVAGVGAILAKATIVERSYPDSLENYRGKYSHNGRYLENRSVPLILNDGSYEEAMEGEVNKHIEDYYKEQQIKKTLLAMDNTVDAHVHISKDVITITATKRVGQNSASQSLTISCNDLVKLEGAPLKSFLTQLNANLKQVTYSHTKNASSEFPQQCTYYGDGYRLPVIHRVNHVHSKHYIKMQVQSAAYHVAQHKRRQQEAKEHAESWNSPIMPSPTQAENPFAFPTNKYDPNQPFDWGKNFGVAPSSGQGSGSGSEPWFSELEQFISDAWNNPIARVFVPDKIGIGADVSITVFGGTLQEIGLVWIVRGNDARLLPYPVFVSTGQGGPDISADVSLHLSEGWYDVMDLRTLPKGKASSALGGSAFYGGGTLGLGVGASGTYSQGYNVDQTTHVKELTWSSFDIGIGLEGGGGGYGGYSYTIPLFKTKK